jgi:hypothetical protein
MRSVERATGRTITRSMENMLRHLRRMIHLSGSFPSTTIINKNTILFLVIKAISVSTIV